MYTMNKLPPSSPHFNHGTIIRTGIYSLYYIPMFLILLFFSLLKFKILFKFTLVRNIYTYILHVILIYIHTYIYIYICMYVYIYKIEKTTSYFDRTF